MKTNASPAIWKLVAIFIVVNLLNLLYLSGTNLDVTPQITVFTIGLIWSGAALYSFFIYPYNYALILSTVFLSFAIPTIALEQVAIEYVAPTLLGVTVFAVFGTLFVGTLLGFKVK